MLVDPKVYAVAEAFIDDLFDEVWRARPERWLKEDLRKPLIDRAAAAMQRAIEDECNAIGEELIS